MDNRTLLIALAIIAASYSFLFALLSLKRKEKSFLIFSIGYFFAIFLAILTYQQGNWNPIFSVVLLNMTYFIFLFLLSAGFKVIYNLPLLSKRTIPLFIIFLVVFIVFTFIVPHYSIRIIISSVMALLVIYDNYVDLSSKLKKESPKYLVVAKTVIGIYLVIATTRVIFAISTFKAEGLLIEDNLFTTITNMFIFISINIWSMMILSADYAKLQSILEHQNEELKRLALKDSLTGLYNRHFLEQEIDKYTQIAKVYNQPLSFIMFDLDNFKVVNDVYGHDYGDEVLIKVAQVTRNSIRTSDIAYRWGGEEFLIILPNTDAETANVVAEKLRINVKEAFSDKVGQVTISLGVSEYKATDSSQSWFRRADYGLSQAKKSGKDKVVVWPTHQPLPLAFATVDWHESWNSGHPEIDKQHKELIHLSNELAHIALERENIEKVLDQLQIIMTHVIDHFHYEESILFEVGYDQYESHKAEHNALIDRFQKLLEDAKANKVSIKQCFDQIAGTLIIGHLLHYDKLFFPLFNE